MLKSTIFAVVLAVVALAVVSPAMANEIWTGAVSTDWGVGGNWSNGMVPDGSMAAQIDGGTANTPVIDSGSYEALYLFGGTDVLITTGGSLNARKSQIYNGGVTVSGTGVYHTGTYGFEAAGGWELNVVGSKCTVDVAANWIIKWSGTGKLTMTPDADGVTTIYVAGNATLQGELVLDVTGYTPAVGDELLVMSVTGTLTTTTFTDFTVVGGNASDWKMVNTDGVGGTVVAQYVPEPATMTLLGLGGLGVLIRRRRK